MMTYAYRAVNSCYCYMGAAAAIESQRLLCVTTPRNDSSGQLRLVRDVDVPRGVAVHRAE